jgi:methyl halide transferase
MSWEEVWAGGLARGQAFDATSCHPALVELVASNTLLADAACAGPSRALVPGCGRGYEVCALAESGLFESVVGLDIAPSGVAAAEQHAQGEGGRAAARTNFVCADFFDYAPEGGGFHTVVDYTFLCALPPARRGEWAEKMAELVAAGGVLITLIFPLLKKLEDGGPPFGVSFQLFEELLCRAGFEALQSPALLVRHSAPRSPAPPVRPPAEHVLTNDRGSVARVNIAAG